MKTYYAESGETIYNLITRAKTEMRYGREECFIVHNDVKVRCYYNSNEFDILDKFEMQRKIDRMEQSYRR